MILLDTSGLLAAIDSSQRLHEEALEAIEGRPGPLALSPFVLAELDYLLATKIGASAELSLLAEVASGAYRLEPFATADVGAARAVIERYGDQDIGLADASIVVLSERHRALEVLTLDEHHFRALRGYDDQPFRLLPVDPDE